MVKEAMLQSVLGRKKIVSIGNLKRRVVDPTSALGIHWKQMVDMVRDVTFLSHLNSSSSLFAATVVVAAAETNAPSASVTK
eukprot:7336814-Ditylum_brightwellii.AAC.1